MSTPNWLHLETLGSWPCHSNIGKIDKIFYFPYISRCRQPYSKDCGRTTPRHEHPIISSLGCMCWSSFVNYKVSISMVKGLRTPYHDEHGLVLSPLGGRFLQSNKSSETIVTCYACPMLNLSLLWVLTGVVLNEQVSTRVGLLPMVRFEGLREFCTWIATLFPNTMPDEADFSINEREKNNSRQNSNLAHHQNFASKGSSLHVLFT